MTFSVAPHPCQHLILLVLMILGFLMSVSHGVCFLVNFLLKYSLHTEKCTNHVQSCYFSHTEHMHTRARN